MSSGPAQCCCTYLCTDSFAQINGIFKPLLASGGRRVDGAGPQVRISRCWGASGWGLAWPGGLRTSLLSNGVLKHTLINWEKEDGRKTRQVKIQQDSAFDRKCSKAAVCLQALENTSEMFLLRVTCTNSVLEGTWEEHCTENAGMLYVLIDKT